MKFNRIATLFISALLITSSASSCAKWLNVEMEDSIMENTLFKTNEGFMTALNGVYSEMNGTYAGALSMGMIDIMAQYYSVKGNAQHKYYMYANYDYSQESFDSTSGSIWTNLYFLIANLNVILEHCDAENSAITTKYYPFVKGEALALRAMFHFDLLRLYGPIYGPDTENTLVMPYQATTSKEIQPLESAKSILDNVINDLLEAEKLLKDVDPIITEGVLHSAGDENEGNNFRYRQYRMNYYAIQLMLARAYQWQGNKTEAYNRAHNVLTAIEVEDPEKTAVFRFSTKDEIVAGNDRVFGPEVMFSLYNMKRVSNYNSFFNSNVEILNRLTFIGSSISPSDQNSKISSFYDDMNDVRRSMWSVTTETAAGEEDSEGSLSFVKYEDITTAQSRYMVPLMRISEVYLILAECTGNTEEAYGYLNTLRNNRGCTHFEDNDPAVLQTRLTNEFAREVIGEGQLFYHYKRLAMEEIAAGDKASGTTSMTLSNYVLPMPKVEADKRK